MAAWHHRYAPTVVFDAAVTLADHVDYWEEDCSCDANTLWRERELTSFIHAGAYADPTKQSRFRQLLAQYVELSVASARSQPQDSLFHSNRRAAVREAIVEIKRWLGERSEQAPDVGVKRGREVGLDDGVD